MPINRVLHLNIPGFDWQVAQPMVDADLLPNLKHVVESGTIGKLVSAPPFHPEVSATTLSTGQRPLFHGIHQPTMPDQEHGIRPVTSADVQTARLWDMAAAQDATATAIGWPVTTPAPVNSPNPLIIADSFAAAHGRDLDHWPLSPSCLSDPSHTDILKQLRLHPTEITAEVIGPFIPALAKLDQETDERMTHIMEVLAQTVTLHAAGTWLVEAAQHDLISIHLPLIERLAPRYMQYAAPRMGHVSAMDHDLFGEVVSGGYRFLDMLLGRYLELMSDDTTLILTSNYGVWTGTQRFAPKAKQLNAIQRTNTGAIAAMGPRIAADALIFGTSSLSIAPTILALMGLEVPATMHKNLLTELTEPKLSPALSTAPLSPPRQALAEVDQTLATHQMLRLVGQDEIAKPPNDREAAYESATASRLLTIAQAQFRSKTYKAALKTLAQMAELAPGHPALLTLMARINLQIGNLDAADATLSELTDLGESGPTLSRMAGVIALKLGRPDEAMDHYLEARDLALEERHTAAPALIGLTYSLLSAATTQGADTEAFRAEASETAQIALDLAPNNHNAMTAVGHVRVAHSDHKGAIGYFRRSLGVMQMQPSVHAAIGQAQLAMGEPGNALHAFQTAQSLDPQFPRIAERIEHTIRQIGDKVDT